MLSAPQTCGEVKTETEYMFKEEQCLNTFARKRRKCKKMMQFSQSVDLDIALLHGALTRMAVCSSGWKTTLVHSIVKILCLNNHLEMRLMRQLSSFSG